MSEVWNDGGSTASRRDAGGRFRSGGGECPECGGHLVSHGDHGETACRDCGLVVEEDPIDTGPEWRGFDHDERQARCRVGAPRTELRHDRGLTTTIDWRNRDASGQRLSPERSRKMERLRNWNSRCRTTDAKERNLRHALGEIDRMGCALGLPDHVRETASVLYRRALDEDLVYGRSIESVASAALYAAARQASVPRSVDEVARVSRVERLRITRSYRYVARELGLVVDLADPEAYLRRFASDLGVDSRTENLASELVAAGRESGVNVGKSPTSVAAAALYAAALMTDGCATQDDVSEVADVSTVTIRSRYTELLEAHGSPEAIQ